MIYAEPKTEEEEKEYLTAQLKEQLKYAQKENWEEVINWIIEYASRKKIKL